MMKTSYVLLLSLASLISNIFSLSNFRLGFVSLFLLLITFIPSIYDQIFDRFYKQEGKEHLFLAKIVMMYFSHDLIILINRIAMIFGLIVIYGMSAGAMYLQMNDSTDIVQLIARDFNIGFLATISPYLGVLGWILFLLSLIFVTIHTLQLMKSSAIFSKDNN